MDKIPFSIYDFFGYLAPGVLLVASVDYFFVDQKLIEYADKNVLTGVISILLIYMLGHIIATPSAWFLESRLVKKNLKAPRETLFLTKYKITGFKKLFSAFYKPLSTEVKRGILEGLEIKKDTKLDKEKCREIFQIAFSKVKTDEQSILSLNTFLYLYGFARNISLTCFIVAIMLFISTIISGVWANTYWIVGFLIAGITMLYRFLKFYRHYTYDMFLSYFALTEKKDSSARYITL